MKYDIGDLLALNMAHVGSKRFNALISCFGSTKEILNAPANELRRVKGIGPELAQRITDAKDVKKIDKELRLIKEYNAGVVTLFDEAYPEILKNIYDPPVVLYIKGGILPRDNVSIALVGSRRASYYGLNICRALSKGLVNSGVTVISGLARGIDSAAHRGALEGCGRTLAVLGSGLANIYPPENITLAEDIAASGALISEFPMEAAPVAVNFPIRNRVISGLSLGVVVVEAARKSGALITADFALEDGREVFAVPGKAGSVTAIGTHALIRKGAKLVESVSDILEELNIGAESAAEKPARAKMEKDEKAVFEVLSDEPEHIDDIVDKSSLSADKVAALLFKLEMKKAVKQLPGKNFITA